MPLARVDALLVRRWPRVALVHAILLEDGGAQGLVDGPQHAPDKVSVPCGHTCRRTSARAESKQAALQGGCLAAPVIIILGTLSGRPYV